MTPARTSKISPVLPECREGPAAASGFLGAMKLMVEGRNDKAQQPKKTQKRVLPGKR